MDGVLGDGVPQLHALALMVSTNAVSHGQSWTNFTLVTFLPRESGPRFRTIDTNTAGAPHDNDRHVTRRNSTGPPTPFVSRCAIVRRAMHASRDNKPWIIGRCVLASSALLVGCRGGECTSGDRCADAMQSSPDASAMDVVDEPLLDAPSDRPTCEAGLDRCGTRCTSLASDPQHCGACGSRCPSDQQCIEGRCACRASEFFCNDRCTPRNNSDPSHCGECGRRCEIGCSAGQCLRVLEVAHGLEGACARLSDDSVRCWGNNRLGGVGDGTFVPRLTPIDIPALRGARNLLARTAVFRAVLPQVGMVGWGVGYWTFGDGILRANAASPTALPALHGTRLSVPSFDCWGGVWPDGSVRLWSNDRCSIDLAGGVYRTPTVFPGLDATTKLVVHDNGGCAIDAGGVVRCWGDPINVTNYAVETRVPQGVGLSRDVDSNATGTCVVQRDGTVRCWGFFGRQGTMDPTLVGRLPAMRSISLMYDNACAVSTTDELWCWGENRFGQLGNGTTVRSDEPVRVAIGPVQSIATSPHGICAILRDGMLRCWGHNRGSIGDGTMEDRSVPTAPRWR